MALEQVSTHLFFDDVMLKEGSLKKWESRINNESPTEWYDDWDDADRLSTFTADSHNWRVHYKNRFPLVFYHNKKFVFGIRKPPTFVQIDQQTDDIVWAKIDGDVVVERADYPRFTTRDQVFFSHTPMVTERENVFRLGNGYSIACAKTVMPIEYGAVTSGKAWWMIGPTEEEEELSHRVLMVKIYDGPHPYQSRGTDIILSDPIPVNSEAEYVIYSYDNSGIRGLYRENYRGVAPQKHAMTLQGDELFSQIIETEGKIQVKNGQITGPGKIRIALPLSATKLLNFYMRGSELEYRLNPDETDWVRLDNYDGKAVNDLEIEIDVYNSLASIRVEWESLKDWEPVGRPKVDILPAGWGGNLIRMELEEGEGLIQSNSLYTGAYTISANVKCITGQVVVDVGGIDVVSWNPVDKSIRGSGDFVVNNDTYEFFVTGNGHTIFEIDRFRVAEAGQREWVPDDLEWYIETESGRYSASESINNKSIPVALGEAKEWRIGIDAPANMGELDEVAISAIYNSTFNTGAAHALKNVKWNGVGRSRVYYPQNVTSAPVVGEYTIADGRGALSWEQTTSVDEGDVQILLDGSPVAYREETTYRPVTIQNRRWRVDIGETRATVFFDGQEVGFMLGQGIPFRIQQNNSEDVQLDCSIGFIQMRRELGPRFEGWTLGNSVASTISSGPRVVWGMNDAEARQNLPYYTVTIGR
jgi:hypothetical protein